MSFVRLASFLSLLFVLLLSIGVSPAKAHEPYESFQWALGNTGGGANVINAWNTSKGGGAVVGVIDTGADLRHGDLKSNIIFSKSYAWPFLASAQDRDGHGTHVAGIIAAPRNNKGIVGVAPNAKLAIIRAEDKNGKIAYKNLTKSINLAGMANLRIVNISMGFPLSSDKQRKLLSRYPKTLFIVSAGNDMENIDRRGNAH